MPESLLLVDTDIFIILSVAGLFDSAVSSLGFDIAHTRRLLALENQVTKGAWFRKRYSEAAREATLCSAQRVPVLVERPHGPDVRDRLAAYEEIDDGEALLFAVLFEHKNWILATGDKRAIIALATQPELRDIRNHIRGRVVCLETIIPALLRIIGIKSIAAAFAPQREHATLRLVFPEGPLTKESVCQREIAFYLRKLEEKVGTNFLLKP